jgi:hypothetical protein
MTLASGSPVGDPLASPRGRGVALAAWIGQQDESQTVTVVSIRL